MTITLKEMEINNHIIILRAEDNHFETWLLTKYGQKLERKTYGTKQSAQNRFNHLRKSLER